MHIILLYLLLLPIVTDIDLELVACLSEEGTSRKTTDWIHQRKFKFSELLKSRSLRIQTIHIKKTGF